MRMKINLSRLTRPNKIIAFFLACLSFLFLSGTLRSASDNEMDPDIQYLKKLSIEERWAGKFPH